MALLREQVVRAVAQAAVELEVARMRVDVFVARFPEVAVELKPRRKRRGHRAQDTFSQVEVEVRHEAQTPSAGLARRAQLRELLEDALEASLPGAFDGGSSGEFHFEYTFRVRDAARAIDVLREALLLAGVATSQFDVDDLGPED